MFIPKMMQIYFFILSNTMEEVLVSRQWVEAFGSLGADISAGQINPASFGRFSTSQVSVSLGSPINSTQSNFDSTGNAAKASSVGFTIPSFGVVFTKDLSLKNNGDMYSQFAFGINRLSNYKQNMVIEGV